MKIKHHESRNTAGVAMEAARLSKENDYLDDNFNNLQKQGNRSAKKRGGRFAVSPPPPLRGLFCNALRGRAKLRRWT